MPLIWGVLMIAGGILCIRRECRRRRSSSCRQPPLKGRCRWPRSCRPGAPCATLPPVPGPGPGGPNHVGRGRPQRSPGLAHRAFRRRHLSPGALPGGGGGGRHRAGPRPLPLPGGGARPAAHCQGDLRAPVARASLNQSWMAEAPVIVIIAAEYRRCTNRYGDRGIMYTTWNPATWAKCLPEGRGLGVGGHRRGFKIRGPPRP